VTVEREVYDRFYTAEDRHWWFRARRRIIAAVLNEILPGAEAGASERTIADVGCGTGGMVPLLSRFGRVTGVDAAPEAREYCARRGLDRILTPEEWSEGGERYDLVTAFDVTEHVEDDVAFLRRLAGHLAPAGRLLVTVPAYPFLWSSFDEMNHHRRRYTKGSLARALRDAGIGIERITYMNGFLLAPVAGVRMVEKLLGRTAGDAESRRRELDRWFRVGPLNGVLEAIFAAERHWLARGNLPAGASVLAWGRVA
jgi:SAM-dependent methyltransferase